MFPHSSFYPFFALRLLPSAGAVYKLLLPDGMQRVNFGGCYRLTGTAESRMSEVYIYLIRFGGQLHTFPHSSPSPSFFLLPRRAVFFLAGDLAQLQLPVGLKYLNLGRCRKLKGKAQSKEYDQ